ATSIPSARSASCSRASTWRRMPISASSPRRRNASNRDAWSKPMDVLNVPRPAWMTEDLVVLEEQARRFFAAEFVPHVEAWHEAGIMDRDAWKKAGEAG